MRRRAAPPASTGPAGLTRRDFLILGTAAGVGIGFTTSTPSAVAATPVAPAAAAAPEREHRTLLGVL
jgi:hypothetical protein